MGIASTYKAYSFLRLLTTPFEKTEAFKLGVIDDEGNLLKGKKERKTKAEKESYNAYNRIVFNLKRVLGRVPFMKGKLGSLAAALYLLKEELELVPDDTSIEDAFVQYLRENRIMLEDDIKDFIEEYASEYLVEDAPVNAVGNPPGEIAGLHGDPPVSHKKKKKKRKKLHDVDIFEVGTDLLMRARLRSRTKESFLRHLGKKPLADEIKLYQKKFPKHPIILQDKTGVTIFLRR